jgi:hypothetical protein
VAITDNTISGGTRGIYCYATGSTGAYRIVSNEVSGASGEGIRIDNAMSSGVSALMADNEVHDNAGRGIYCFSQRNSKPFAVELRGNTVSANGGDGIYFDQGGGGDKFTQLITLNTVTGNGGYGIYSEDATPVEIFYNEVSGNSGDGLYLAGGDGSAVNYNNIYNNSGAHALVNGNGSAVDARFNHWGKGVTAEMDAGDNPKDIGRIHDNQDDAALGNVDYAEWLTDRMENVDTDGDRLLNIWEYENGLDPLNSDSDNDGLEDGDEKNHWGDDWNADYDGDDLINILDPDSDNDGTLDGDESS